MIKKEKKQKTISLKLSIAITLLVVIYTILLLGYFGNKYKSSILVAATTHAQLSAKVYAEKIRFEIENKFDISRTLAEILSAKYNKNSKLNISRKSVNDILNNILESNPLLLGLYTAWEPNAFDNNDSLFAKLPNNHPKGLFVPYWARDSKGNTITENLTFHTTSGKGEYYLTPRTTKKEMITNPTDFKIGDRTVSLVSLVVPILEKNNFRGVVGTDIWTENIQEIVNNSDIFEGNGKMMVLSNNGSIIATTDTSKFIGKSASIIFPDLNYKVDEVTTIDYKDDIIITVPIILGNTDTPWYVIVNISKKYLLKDVFKELMFLFFISLTVLSIIILGIHWLIKIFLKPFRKISKVALQLSEGNLDVWDVPSNSLEVLNLNTAFAMVVDAQREITEVCVAIAAGDYTKTALVKNDKDILAISVNKMVMNLRQNTLDEQQRSWLSVGYNKFSEILRIQNDANQLFQTVIKFLISYTNANQGAIFLVNNENTSDIYIELKSCYAYERTKFIKKHIRPGEGMIGQAYLEKDTIILNEIPEDYINISSGLGFAKPKSLIIIPIKTNDNIEGLLELASFKQFTKNEVEYIEKCAENFSSVIASARTNQITSKLLAEANVAAEQMKMQEEEMRQNMEELSATQEEMERKQNEYLQIIENLKSKKVTFN